MTTDQGPYPAQYPVQFAVEYPDRPLNRLTSFFRIFVIIPIAIVLGAVSGATWESAGSTSALHHSTTYYGPRGRGRPAVLRPAADDLVQAEVPPVVVRLEPGTAALHQPGVDLPGPDATLPVHRRPPVGPASITPIRTRPRTSTAGCRWSNGCWPSRTTSCCSSWKSPRFSR